MAPVQGTEVWQILKGASMQASKQDQRYFPGLQRRHVFTAASLTCGSKQPIHHDDKVRWGITVRADSRGRMTFFSGCRHC